MKPALVIVLASAFAAAAATPAIPARPASGTAPPVEVAQASTAEATTELHSIGSLASDEAVSIAPEIPGRISTIGFQEGEQVKAGDVLVTLDFALARAELANAEAGHRLAQSNFERAASLSNARRNAKNTSCRPMSPRPTGRHAALERAAASVG